jgi:hypothetical protein
LPQLRCQIGCGTAKAVSTTSICFGNGHQQYSGRLQYLRPIYLVLQPLFAQVTGIAAITVLTRTPAMALYGLHIRAAPVAIILVLAIHTDNRDHGLITSGFII